MNDFAQYGILGSVIGGLIVIVRILWKKLETKDETHKKEREEDRESHLAEFKKLFENNVEITKTYSKDSRDFSLVLKELEMILKNQNRK